MAKKEKRPKLPAGKETTDRMRIQDADFAYEAKRKKKK